MNKTTKEYAEKLAEERHAFPSLRVLFEEGYLSAVEETGVRELYQFLDLMIAEVDSDPSAVRYFDLRIIKGAKEALKKLKQ